MTEPTGELFTTASSIRAARLADEETQALETVEEANRQKLIDQKKAADKKLSDERALAFTRIMIENEIPTVTLYRDEKNSDGYWIPQLSKFGDSYKKVPKYKYVRSEVGRGWIIKDFIPSEPGDYYDERISLGNGTKPGLILLEDLSTYKYRVEDKDRNVDDDLDSSSLVVSRERSDPFNYGDLVNSNPIESPYADANGLTLLANLLDKHGIVA